MVVGAADGLGKAREEPCAVEGYEKVESFGTWVDGPRLDEKGDYGDHEC